MFRYNSHGGSRENSVGKRLKKKQADQNIGFRTKLPLLPELGKQRHGILKTSCLAILAQLAISRFRHRPCFNRQQSKNIPKSTWSIHTQACICAHSQTHSPTHDNINAGVHKCHAWKYGHEKNETLCREGNVVLMFTAQV